MTDFETTLKSHATTMEACLEELLVDVSLPMETARPLRLLEAMRYSTLDGGKRLRPFLVMESAVLFGVKTNVSMFAGAALELIHCYSLAHDDLPSVDDDDLRRGRSTTHKAFDEATAILAGDALLTLAFDVLSREETHPDPAARMELVQLYARNAGIGGMVGGQTLDIEAEEKPTLTETEILTLQAMKTGALIRCACEAGAILGNATPAERENLRRFGSFVGQAFQLADDLLDVTASPETMGKQTGKDASAGKGTLVGLLGIGACQTRMKDLLDSAIATLEPFGSRADMLAEAARFTVERKN